MASVRTWRGKWHIDYIDRQGKRHIERGGRTRKEAEKLLRERVDQIEKGTFTPRKDVPTFTEIAHEWLDNRVAVTVRPSTARQYRGHVKNHLEPFFGPIKITEIRVRTIEAFIADRRKADCSVPIINKTLGSLALILSHAVRHRYLDHNPAREAGRVRRDIPVEEMAVFAPAELRKLLDHAPPEYRVLFLTAALTGARQGELLGATWGDVDWERCQLRIERTFNSGRLYSPKSRASHRRIDLAPELIAELKPWRLACPKGEVELIFPNTRGGYLSASNMIRRGWHPTLRRAGLPKLKFHTLRHTYCSLLLAAGENIKYIQSQLGHSSPQVTLTIYSHLFSDTNSRAASLLGKMVFAQDASVKAGAVAE